MRICLVYDCLFPFTVGGGERWYRNLAETLVADGHSVSYLTLRQWDHSVPPGIPGVNVIAVGPRMKLYGKSGARRFVPPIVFGLGVFFHLARHGRAYDVVHGSSFPYFSLLGVWAARRLHRYRIVVDWFELWTREYWRSYIGGLAGCVGYAVQRLCLRVPQSPFCFSALTERRLANEVNGSITRLSGLFIGEEQEHELRDPEQVVVFAGRHIPEKRAPLVVSAIARARKQLPELRGLILGDGPEYQTVLEEIQKHQLEGVVTAPGFVTGPTMTDALAKSLCMVLPSRREGYGLIVIEAASLGVPSVVVAGDDNAAMELIEEGVNGYVARSEDPADIAEAIIRVQVEGDRLRKSTLRWFEKNRDRLSIKSSLDAVVDSYQIKTGKPDSQLSYLP